MQQILKDLQIDPRLIPVMVVGFWLLYLLLRRVLFEPVHGMLENRRAYINEHLDKVLSQEQEADRLREELAKRLADIEAEAREKIQAAIKEANVAREELIAEARARSDAMVKSATMEIEHQREKAEIELNDTIVKIAMTAAGKLLSEEMNEDRQRRLVREFIDSARAT